MGNTKTRDVAAPPHNFLLQSILLPKTRYNKRLLNLNV